MRRSAIIGGGQKLTVRAGRQVARSTPLALGALVGHTTLAHMAQNVALGYRPPLSASDFGILMQRLAAAAAAGGGGELATQDKADGAGRRLVMGGAEREDDRRRQAAGQHLVLDVHNEIAVRRSVPVETASRR